MLTKFLFADLPELFYTINLTPAIFLGFTKFGPLTLALILGLFLILASSIIFLIFYFKKSDGKKYQIALLSLIVIAWLPLYINFTYNNLYDFSENLKALKYGNSSKKILRICDMDNRQNMGGIYCRLFSFATFVKNNLPAGSEAELLTSPGLDGFLNYYLYPDYKIVDKADYLLFYRPNNYLFKDNILYKRQNGEDIIIGKYKMLSAKSDTEFILKKQ